MEFNSSNDFETQSEIYETVLSINSAEDGVTSCSKTIEDNISKNGEDEENCHQEWISSVSPIQTNNTLTERELNGVQWPNNEPPVIKVGENTFQKCNKLNLTGNQTNNIYKGQVLIKQYFCHDPQSTNESYINRTWNQSKNREERSDATCIKLKCLYAEVSDCFSRRSKRCIISTSMAVILSIVFVILLSVFTTESSDSIVVTTTLTTSIFSNKTTSTDASTTGWLPTTPKPSTTETTPPDIELPIISRKEWGARPSKNDIDEFEKPPKYVLIRETKTKSCNSKSSCTEIVRKVQNLALSDGNCDDIEEHFLIGADGSIYEGRGWLFAGEIYNGYYAYISMDISFIGNFDNDKPTEAQLESAWKLIDIGVEKNLIYKNYRLRGLKQIDGDSKDMPGKYLYSIIQTSEHWGEKVSLRCEF